MSQPRKAGTSFLGRGTSVFRRWFQEIRSVQRSVYSLLLLQPNQNARKFHLPILCLYYRDGALAVRVESITFRTWGESPCSSYTSVGCPAQQQGMFINAEVDPAGKMPEYCHRAGWVLSQAFSKAFNVLIYLGGGSTPLRLLWTVLGHSCATSGIIQRDFIPFPKCPSLDDTFYVCLNSGAQGNIAGA